MKPGSRDWDDVILLPLPLFHVYANVGVQTYAIVGHNPLLLVPNPRDINDLLAQIRKERPAFLSAVPTLFIALLNHPDVAAGKADFSSIRICFSGAAPLLAETKRRFEGLTGGRIVEGYSLTEAMMATFVNPVKGPNKIGSVGLPLPDVEVRIVDAEDTQRPLETGSIGEVLIRAPQVMSGYWKNPEETALALQTHGSGGVWLHTGDLGYLDEDGYLFLVDRKKDLIKSSGYQVWPRRDRRGAGFSPSRGGSGRRGRRRCDQGRIRSCVGRAESRDGRHRGRAAHVLPSESRAVQGSALRGIPAGPAKDDDRQSAQTRAGGDFSASTVTPASASPFRNKLRNRYRVWRVTVNANGIHFERQRRAIDGHNFTRTSHSDGTLHHDLDIVDDGP